MAHTHHVLTPRENPALLSLVLPCYNEEEVVPLLRPRLTEFLDSLPCPAEVLLVNDGSSDRTLEMLFAWAKEDPRIKVLGLARNFGHQAAATAGLDAARGDAVVLMDADLQDPPEVVLDMLARYREGYDVVYGQRVSREGETLMKRLTAWGFYRFMRTFIHPDLPADAGDFRLISRPCLETLKEMRELHRFLRGMVAWVGYPQVAVPFKRPARVAGETKYPLHKMLRFAWTAAVSFSPAPLRLSMFVGIIVALIGVVTGFYAIVRYFLHLYDPEVIYTPGWATFTVLLCLIGGAILVSIGILGEYVGRIFEEIKGRPLYIVSTKINLDEANKSAK